MAGPTSPHAPEAPISWWLFRAVPLALVLGWPCLRVRRRGLPRFWGSLALPHLRADAGSAFCARSGRLHNARARRVIPGCRWGFAGRAAGSREQQQPSGFAQHNDKPCAHFLHRRSQRDRRTFQAGSSGSVRPPGLTGEVELQFGCGDRRLRNLLGMAKKKKKNKSFFQPSVPFCTF